MNNVTWQRPEYERHAKQIQLIDKIYNGIDTAKTLIDKLRNEDVTQYDIRVEEATLENFIERIIVTMTGQVTRKPLTFEDTPDNIVDELSDLDELTKELLTYGVKDGKSFLVVTAPTSGGLPYFYIVQRPQLVNWRKNELGEYTLAVIQEEYTVEGEDGFSFESAIQYRVIRENGDVELWRATDKAGSVWTLAEEYNTDYNFCPFYELDVNDVPPLYDIAKLNKKHLNKTSLKDRFLKEALDPMLFAKGLGMDEGSAENPSFIIGVNQITATDNTEADMKWVELDGTNYDIAEKDIANVEEAMAVRALKLQQDSANKTATQTNEEGKESSSRLSDLSNDVEDTLNKSISGWLKIKNGSTFTGKVLTNKDFNITTIDSNLVTALNTLQLSGNLSRDTLLKAIADSEVVTIESLDEEKEAIERDNAGLSEETAIVEATE